MMRVAHCVMRVRGQTAFECVHPRVWLDCGASAATTFLAATGKVKRQRYQSAFESFGKV